MVSSFVLRCRQRVRDCCGSLGGGESYLERVLDDVDGGRATAALASVLHHLSAAMRAGLVIVVMISLVIIRVTGGDISVSHDELFQSLSSLQRQSSDRVSKEEKTADHKKTSSWQRKRPCIYKLKNKDSGLATLWGPTGQAEVPSPGSKLTVLAGMISPCRQGWGGGDV